MLKSEMREIGMKTASLQRLFRKWHQMCLFDNNSEVWVGFGQPAPGKEKQHHATCSNCLINRSVDLGTEPATLLQMRGRQ